jgi:hypothetical protein
MAERRWRKVLLFGVAVGLASFGLTGCKTSGRFILAQSDFHGYCVTMESTVGETADQDANGNTGAVSVTTNRDADCDQEEAVNTSDWAYIYAHTNLVKRRSDGTTFTCKSDDDWVPYDSIRSQAEAGAKGWCGEGNYFAQGLHEAENTTLYSDHTTSPNGYNS